MVFAKATSDIAFKKLFGDPTRTHLPISFLNAVLERKEGERIVELTIIDPANQPEIIMIDKPTAVDVRCKDETGKTYIIEMQSISQKAYAARSQYYTALTFSRQLKKGEKFDALQPVIFVGVLEFNLFNNPHFISHHGIVDLETRERSMHHLEFHFLELPKFHKHLKGLGSDIDKWAFLLKNADDLETIPNELRNPEPVEDALVLLEEGMWTEAELIARDRYLDMLRSIPGPQEWELEKMRNEGLQQGIQEGQKTAKLEVAKSLLALMPVEQIAQATGLSIQDIEQLKQESK